LATALGRCLVVSSLMFVACSRLGTGTVATDTDPADRAVLQIETWGGFGAFWRIAPAVTIWESGRVVFVADDRSVRAGRIPIGTVAQLMRQAAFLYDLNTWYAVCACSDVSTTDFSVRTEGAQKKTVSVEGYSIQAWTAEYDAATIDRLRDLHRAVLAVLPATAPHFEPEEVVVRAEPVEASGFADLVLRARPWPASLVGHLTSQRAREALRLRPLTPPGAMEDVFTVDRQVRRITLEPVLPRLNRPRLHWPPIAIPVHPAASAYNAPGEPYRFAGITKEEIAAWYREVMPAEGWAAAHELRDGGQVWVRATYPHDPIVKLQFDFEHYRLLVVEAQNLVPRAPTDMYGDDTCLGLGCWRVDEMTPQELEAWYREHLRYLGWREAEPNAYWRGRPLDPSYPPILPADLVRREYEALRLMFTTEHGRTTIRTGMSVPVIPAGGWPQPEAEDDRWLLCDETRGGEVLVAGEVHRLHPSLCVTLSEPGRLRVQVAYGWSFVELDPETGERIAEAATWFEQPLRAHLTPFLPRLPFPPPVATPSPRQSFPRALRRLLTARGEA
jgi:hypothetical protein